MFRFAIMGAGGIANKFCDAVSLVPDAEVSAISSKSIDRAADFADRHRLPAYYDSYERMLEEERPDCVYIAVTHDAHFDLAMLCLAHDTPILCEKSMFQNAREAETYFAASEKRGIFSMEAMWSRFLPPVVKAREWVKDGRIGRPVFGDMTIGFRSSPDPENRINNPKLGGGAALDITVYSYDVLTRVIDRPVLRASVEATKMATGVDDTDIALLRFEGGVLGVCKSTVACSPDERLIVEGTEGRILLPHSHVGNEAQLWRGGRLVEHFIDNETKNGFTYEIEETIRMIRAGKIESKVCPHAMTLEFARLCDRIFEKAE
ncbi:MAG: Gfo/Idh/MocA family oxidoreductase [Clostridiales bacterium]|nr:Gfo/Idh/MocA family oxidoreductase [Clostridiales bacterium]